MIRRSSFAALALFTAGEAAAQEAETRFIACPIFRDVDAGRKSGCWLADDPTTGARYDIGSAPTKPDWNREVLVEGRPSSRPDACGGVVLDPVRVSVLQGACTRHTLPAESFKGRAFVLPERSLRPLSEARIAPAPPFRETTFHLQFDWNRDFMVYQLDDHYFDQAVSFIRGVNPGRVIVTGYAATKPTIVSGRKIAEDAAIARSRADKIAEALIRMGVDPKIIDTNARTGAEPATVPAADGLSEPSRRRVDIRVIPQ